MQYPKIVEVRRVCVDTAVLLARLRDPTIYVGRSSSGYIELRKRETLRRVRIFVDVFGKIAVGDRFGTSITSVRYRSGDCDLRAIVAMIADAIVEHLNGN